MQSADGSSTTPQPAAREGGLAQVIPYTESDDAFDVFIARPESEEPRPAVLVIHTWAGRDDFAENKAKKLAELGYVGAAIDLYGVGKRGHDKASSGALMQGLITNPARAPVVRRLGGRVHTVDRSFFDDGKHARLVVHSPKSFEIYVPNDVSVAVARFHVAHELGHFFLQFPLIEEKKMAADDLGASALRKSSPELRRVEAGVVLPLFTPPPGPAQDDARSWRT